VFNFRTEGLPEFNKGADIIYAFITFVHEEFDWC